MAAEQERSRSSTRQTFLTFQAPLHYCTVTRLWLTDWFSYYSLLYFLVSSICLSCSSYMSIIATFSCSKTTFTYLKYSSNPVIYKWGIGNFFMNRHTFLTFQVPLHSYTLANWLFFLLCMYLCSLLYFLGCFNICLSSYSIMSNIAVERIGQQLKNQLLYTEIFFQFSPNFFFHF